MSAAWGTNRFAGRVVRLRESVVSARAADEVIALDRDASYYYAVNPTAARALWPALEAGARADELARSLATAFDVDLATATRDVTAFLDALEAHGLLEEVDQ